MYIYLSVYKQMTNVDLWLLYSNIWNHLPAKKWPGSFMSTNNVFSNI